jgi:hypothetical protein
MVKATGTCDDGRPLTVFGLEPENVRRLQAGIPIRVDMSRLGHPEFGVVVILFGETREQIAEQLGAAHLLPEAEGKPS